MKIKVKLHKVVLCLIVSMLTMLNLATITAHADGKLTITTTLFPQYDFAKAIAGDKADVTMILPLGSESHNYEPSPSDVIAIDQSDMFIYTGDYMEGWVSNIVGNLNDTMVVDVSQGITLDKVEDDDEDEEHSTDDGHHHDYDPHIWTSPRNAMVIVDNITNALCELDSQNADYYQSNAQEYKLKLQNLDDEFQSVVDNGNTNKIFFGGKFALYYLARDYGLEYTSAYDSCSDETEPSAKAVANIISQMKQQHIPVIFYEELTNPTVAETIANETGATPLLFHSCHNVSKEEFESGATYLSLMEQNVENLRIALDTPTVGTDTNTTSTIEDTSSLLGILKTLISYPFMRQALIVGPLVSLCASLLGVTLVLKRYSMIGDGLSHVGFGALSIAMAMNVAPLKVSIPVVIVSAFFLLKISQNSKIKGDSAIAIISSSALAIGITVTSLTSGLSTDINNYMFGSILALSKSDVYLSVILSILVIVLYLVFYNKIFTVTFDENFAKATGIHTDVYNFLIAILTAITIVIGMRLMGSLLISSLIIFPSLSSMRVFNSFKSVILSSAVISIVCFLVGIFVSYVLGIPVGASIVITNLIVFLMFLCVGKATKRS